MNDFAALILPADITKAYIINVIFLILFSLFIFWIFKIKNLRIDHIKNDKLKIVYIVIHAIFSLSHAPIAHSTLLTFFVGGSVGLLVCGGIVFLFLDGHINLTFIFILMLGSLSLLSFFLSQRQKLMVLGCFPFEIRGEAVYVDMLGQRNLLANAKNYRKLHFVYAAYSDPLQDRVLQRDSGFVALRYRKDNLTKFWICEPSLYSFSNKEVHVEMFTKKGLRSTTSITSWLLFLTGVFIVLTITLQSDYPQYWDNFMLFLMHSFGY